MQENHINFYSHVMGRNIDINVYGHWGYPVVLFPTSMGNAWQYKENGLLQTVADRLDHGEIKIYSIGSIDHESFYSDELSPNVKIFNYSLYMKFLKQEFIPFVQRECNVHRVGVAGCSFGAFHAVNFAFQNPDAVSFLIAMSGSFSIQNFMHGYYDDHVYFNSPHDYMINQESWIFNHMKIVLGTSDWDICREENLKLSRLLGQKQINHWYDEKKWIAHDWPLWNMAFPEYLNTFL